MFFLNILDNETILLIAETLFIVIGSMLLGILLSYFIWGGMKKQVEDLESRIAEEKTQTQEIRDQMNELLLVREHLKNEIAECRIKADAQSRTIYDQNQVAYTKETQLRNLQATIDGLQMSIDSYQRRLNVIEEELAQAKNPVLIPHTIAAPITIRANYDHVSKLLGKPVTENDLTLIVGIGPKTAELLQNHGITTWHILSETPIESLKEFLANAGGIYKSHDPSSWPKQAFMASQSEWRKLRVYQDTLKKHEQG